MEDTKSRDKPKDSDRASPELRVVRVASNPGPDAEDRLRRLFSLLVNTPPKTGKPRRRRTLLPTLRLRKTMPGRKAAAPPPPRSLTVISLGGKSSPPSWRS